MKIAVYNLAGEKVKDLTLKKDIFGVKINETLMAQAIRVYQSNQRLSPARTKTRSEVNLSTRKIYRQKGTGGARHGDRKAPIFVGGSKALGPTGEENYQLKLTKKMKTAAFKSALSQKASDKAIIALDGLTQIKEPKTKKAAAFLSKIYKPEDLRKITLVVNPDMKVVYKSFKNISAVDCVETNRLSTYQILNSRSLILTSEALETLEIKLANK